MKTLDATLQIYLPDDYYEEIREKLKPEIIDYVKYYCKKQVQKCRAVYSANRHKTPIKIKKELMRSLITEFE